MPEAGCYKSIKSLVKEFGLKDYSVRQAIHNDEVKHSYFGGRYWVDVDSLIDLFESRSNVKSPKGRKPLIRKPTK